MLRPIQAESSLERAKVTIDDTYTSKSPMSYTLGRVVESKLLTWWYSIINRPGRASFSFASKPAQLQLEQIRLDDEGEYRCRVDFKRGRTVNTIISLRVIVPPEDLKIVSPNKPSQRLEGLIGPFNEGTELVLLCLANGGKPRPQISWRRDFNVIDETYQHLDKDGKSIPRNSISWPSNWQLD